MASTPREQIGQGLSPTKNGMDLSPRQEQLLLSLRYLHTEMDRQMTELEWALRDGSRPASKKTMNKISPRPASRGPNGKASSRHGDYSDQGGVISVESTAEPLLGDAASRGTSADSRYAMGPRTLSLQYRGSETKTRQNAGGAMRQQDENGNGRRDNFMPTLDASGSFSDYDNPEIRSDIPRTRSGQSSQDMRALRKLLETDHALEHHYHGEGWAATLSQNDMFQKLTFAIILGSSIWIAVDTDLNKPDASPNLREMFFIVDHCVLIYFIFEIFVRFLAFSSKREAFSLASFNFDLILVVVMVCISWVMPLMHFFAFPTSSQLSTHMHRAGSFKLLRLFRLVRLARLARLVRAWPDLVVLVRGMVAALRAVFSTFCLLTVVIYVFGIFFTQMLAGSGAVSGKFETVPLAMVCLLLDGIFNSQAGLIYELLEIHWVYFVVIMAYECVAFLTIMNMLLGVICNEVTQVAKTETDARQLAQIRAKLQTALAAMDDDGDQRISKNEFEDLLQKKDVLRVLHDVGVDVTALWECGEFIFLNRGNDLSYEDFMDEVLKFRTCNTATVKDTVDVRLTFVYEMKQLERQLKMALAGQAYGSRSESAQNYGTQQAQAQDLRVSSSDWSV